MLRNLKWILIIGVVSGQLISCAVRQPAVVSMPVSVGQEEQNSANYILNEMETKMKTLVLTGDQDHDYLANMMSLQYRATQEIAAQIGKPGTSTDTLEKIANRQHRLFVLAAALLEETGAAESETRFPLTTKTEEKKDLFAVYLEMVLLNQKITASSSNPVVIEFAKMSGDEIVAFTKSLY